MGYGPSLKMSKGPQLITPLNSTILNKWTQSLIRCHVSELLKY